MMKVLLVDDHPLILSALQTMIHRLDPAITVLTAENAVDGFELLAQQPDVGLLLLDLDLGDEVDGFTVLAEMRHRHPSLPVVVLSAAERLADMVRAVDMGAMGFLPKRSAIKDLLDALALVVSGGVYIPPALLGVVSPARVELADADAQVDAARSAATEPVAGLGSGSAPDLNLALLRPMADPLHTAALAGPASLTSLSELGLTRRQAEVLTWLLKGLSNKLIARELNLSVDTVKDHVAAVLRALSVTSRTQAVLRVSQMNQPAPG